MVTALSHNKYQHKKRDKNVKYEHNIERKCSQVASQTP